jgi:hypothetical protein
MNDVLFERRATKLRGALLVAQEAPDFSGLVRLSLAAEAAGGHTEVRTQRAGDILVSEFQAAFVALAD